MVHAAKGVECCLVAGYRRLGVAFLFWWGKINEMSICFLHVIFHPPNVGTLAWTLFQPKPGIRDSYMLPPPRIECRFGISKLIIFLCT